MFDITLISLDGTAPHALNTIYPNVNFKTTMVEKRVRFKTCDERVESHLQRVHYDAIVAPGNSFGHMTGGFDGGLVNVFGQALDRCVRQAINDEWLGELPVGNACVFQLQSAEAQCIVYAPTMRAPRTLPANSEAPYLATLAAFQRIRNWNRNRRPSQEKIQRILLPLMGGCTGELDINTVARQMQLALIRAVTAVQIDDLFVDGTAWDVLIRG